MAQGIVLEDVPVPLKTGGIGALLGDPKPLSAKEQSKRTAERETYSDLQGILRLRQESESPVKLTIRSGSYDADMVEGLRLVSREFEIDASCQLLGRA